MSARNLTVVIAGGVAASVAALMIYQRMQQQKTVSVLIEEVSPGMVDSDATQQTVIASNLSDVRKRLRAAATARSRNGREPVLLAVSKAMPVDVLLEAYAAGQRDFAESYVQEVTSKVTQMPPDCRWHFIGSLQSNKAEGLVRGCGPALAVIETVDSANIADKIDAAVSSLPEVLLRARRSPLEVMILVNTSPWEGTKSGVLAADVPALADHIRTRCLNVKLGGLMTIGAPATPKCFTALCKCRDALAAHLRVRPDTLRLSMGMSNDFEQAIAAGSDSVRVGSTIFGGRN